MPGDRYQADENQTDGNGKGHFLVLVLLAELALVPELAVRLILICPSDFLNTPSMRADQRFRLEIPHVSRKFLQDSVSCRFCNGAATIVTHVLRSPLAIPQHNSILVGAFQLSESDDSLTLEEFVNEVKRF